MNKHLRWANLVDRKSAQPQLRTSTVLWTSVLSRMAHAECTGAHFGLASSSAMPKVPAPASAQHHLRPNAKATACSCGATSPRAPFGPTRRQPPHGRRHQPAHPLRPNAKAASFNAKFASSHLPLRSTVYKNQILLNIMLAIFKHLIATQNNLVGAFVSL